MLRSVWCKVYAVTVAVGTSAWWVLILTTPAVRALFLWPGCPEASLLAFLPADTVFIVLAPLVWAVKPSLGVWNVHRYATHFATLVTLTLCLLTRGGWLGGAMMVVVSVGAEVVAGPWHLPTRPIEAKSRGVLPNALKTVGQTAVMWTVFLVLLPWSLRLVETMVGVPPLPAVSPVALWTVFWAAGLTGLYSGLLFATHGHGTPLPLDTTARVVVMGPYRVVRNPMAVLGILQGVVVGLLLCSPVVVLYALAGAVAWHVLARPWEERDLSERFGQAYEDYRKAVRNWVPTLRPYPKTVMEKADGSNDA